MFSLKGCNWTLSLMANFFKENIVTNYVNNFVDNLPLSQNDGQEILILHFKISTFLIIRTERDNQKSFTKISKSLKYLCHLRWFSLPKINTWSTGVRTWCMLKWVTVL